MTPLVLVLLAVSAWPQENVDIKQFLKRSREGAGVADAPAVALTEGNADAPKPRFFESLPETFTASDTDPLETALVDAAASRGALEWFDVSREVKIKGKKYKVTVPVSNALKIDGVRVNIRYDFAQKLADRLGLVLPTPAVADLVQKNATVRFSPQSGPMQEDVVAGRNTSVTAMIKHSRLVDAAVDGRSGLANNEGKWFVLTNQFWWAPQGRQKSAIYGWWRDDGSVIQSGYLAHELQFADYSQVIRFMGKKSTYQEEGGSPQDIDTAALLSDKDSPGHTGLAWLLSDEGPLPEPRHPAVPKP